jgi:hypothetical protein
MVDDLSAFLPFHKLQKISPTMVDEKLQIAVLLLFSLRFAVLLCFSWRFGGFQEKMRFGGFRTPPGTLPPCDSRNRSVTQKYNSEICLNELSFTPTEEISGPACEDYMAEK